jgi:hypothetical protein
MTNVSKHVNSLSADDYAFWCRFSVGRYMFIYASVGSDFFHLQSGAVNQTWKKVPRIQENTSTE